MILLVSACVSGVHQVKVMSALPAQADAVRIITDAMRESIYSEKLLTAAASLSRLAG